ncbi:MAG: RDD family protein [Alphaproteobacteria bacterium]|nr:RDD family protein [Alphaproteobacteria bacterium]MCB9796104.1 RDD family protein [Alphaproteobacteria bacterium]
MSAPGLGRRALARGIDALLLAGLGVAWGYPLGFSVPWLVGHAALVYLAFVAGDALWGGTPGKRLLGLTVEGPDGARPSWGQAARREAFMLVGAVPFVGPLLALGFWIATAVTIRGHGEGEGLHDRWAGGTRVRALG